MHDTEPVQCARTLPTNRSTGSEWPSELGSATYPLQATNDADVHSMRSLVTLLQDDVAIAQQLLREHRIERREAAARETELQVRAVGAERRAEEAERRADVAENRAALAELELRRLESIPVWHGERGTSFDANAV